MAYDSRQDTMGHIATVRLYLWDVVMDLVDRGDKHDRSKLENPELSYFDEFTPKLADTTYGSKEYKGFLEEMKPALDHHYKVNDHHPEHFPEGIAGMDLVQVIEMLCDWKAATERHKDGDLRKSIEMNAKRFGFGYEMKELLLNTAHNKGWL